MILLQIDTSMTYEDDIITDGYKHDIRERHSLQTDTNMTYEEDINYRRMKIWYMRRILLQADTSMSYEEDIITGRYKHAIWGGYIFFYTKITYKNKWAKEHNDHQKYDTRCCWFSRKEQVIIKKDSALFASDSAAIFSTASGRAPTDTGACGNSKMTKEDTSILQDRPNIQGVIWNRENKTSYMGVLHLLQMTTDCASI